ncbi:MAG: EscU/YscU/HrcU family type III secretion system export apparatus switch protein [Spirochaetaceae bacterium]|jgi:type III secretion system FlhB-like substrate exporter|nr:EscU/YscU/HrcU family type III secretion system export apparatus switch protein [Spirochaetaceae bacterium]
MEKRCSLSCKRRGLTKIEKQRKIASAVGYNPEEGVPRIVALGQGREAEQIIARAREAGIAVIEDPALAAALTIGHKPGDYVPQWCWEAVAKILAFVFTKEAQE